MAHYYSNLINNKINELNDLNKNVLYKYLKINEKNYYLNHPNKEHRKLLAKFRVSDHELLIEKGRYTKIPRDQRLCKNCNLIEDEIHFFFQCKNNILVRVQFLQKYEKTYTDFDNKTLSEKLVAILNPSTPEDIKAVVSFIKQSLELRKGGS